MKNTPAQKPKLGLKLNRYSDKDQGLNQWLSYFCFCSSFLPDAELESLLKKHFVSVSFFKGTVLSGEDCRRVKVCQVHCVLIKVIL